MHKDPTCIDRSTPCTATDTNIWYVQLCIAELSRSVFVHGGIANIYLFITNNYFIQVEILRSRLAGREGLEIKSVDGFQGREKEAVVLTLVRSNKSREVGFLSEIRRLNVAITRARRHLCIIGNSETVSSCADIAKLVDYAHTSGEVHCADQYSSGQYFTDKL